MQSPQRTTSAGPTAEHVLIVEQGGRGGVADYTAALVRALAARGCTVELATAADHRYGTPPPGVTIHRVFRYLRAEDPAGRLLRRARLGRVGNGLLFLAALPGLVRLARRVDLVHTEGWELAPLGLMAVAALRLSGATVVQTEHNTFERGTRFERTRRMLARMTARTIVHTHADVPRAYASVRGQAVVIPHGEYGTLARSGGEADRATARAALGIPSDASVVILFGQLRADKGLGDLVAAARRVPEIHVIVAGEDGGALGTVRPALAAPGLVGRVHVREGFIEMDEAARLFAAADAAVLPYPRASQSGVLLLAYGFSCPVLAYPVGGLVEAIEDGETGWICSRADVDALVEGLEAVAGAGAQECRRRGEAGRRLAERRFGWDDIAVRTIELYRDVSGSGSRADDERTIRLLFARELAAGAVAEDEIAAPVVLRTMRSRPVGPKAIRVAAVLRRRAGRLDYERSIAAPLDAARRAVLGSRAAGPPRFLVRVDEFPHYRAWDEEGPYSTERFRRFHAIMTDAGVPYLIAVPARVSRDPLDPHGTDSRPLSDPEVQTLQSLQRDGTTLALHGRDHRTRDARPRHHSELCGLDPTATAALLDQALAELEQAGLSRPEVFVPPFNRIDAEQYPLLAERFAVICGGPESIALLGFQRTPQWRGGALYLPSYFPLYGHARDVIPQVRTLIEREQALWAPITLHWGWEADQDWEHLARLVEVLGPHAVPWEELLAIVRRERAGTRSAAG